MNLNELGARFRLKATIIAEQTNIKLPERYFRYTPTLCWKCSKEILVFGWPGDRGFTTNGIFPKLEQPAPRTIKPVHIQKTGAKFWSNSCPYCGRLQDAFYLHNNQDVFGHFDFQDKPGAFARDMIKLAQEYFSRY